ncbi:glycosyl transferase group 1 [Candidatus Scalindua japonica]|uniref:Glycosyl transferase group 1 n=1 Tax=Candidatus Scalindua japonica TaxID=1284222 RepID=A0A286TVC1_9BACT|nr:methyltransferase domain-containing protein [Candidatus Scalindua japonica]GAX59819.1 glycosyl transferase group 1 [Candidatus Scalindua japonica]
MNNKLKEGEILFADGKIEGAEQCFLSLVENDSECKEAYNNLGVIAFQNNDKEKAIDYFTRSLEIDPLYRDAVLNYTSLLRTHDQLHIAAHLLEKIAEIRPDDGEITQLLEEIRTTSQIRLKIAILCLPGYESFLPDIVNHLKARYDVQTCYTNNEQEIKASVEWADIVWLEFGNDISVYVTKKVSAIQNKTVVCRIHSYEVLQGYLSNIDFTKIDVAVFVADHVRDIAFETYPSIKNETKTLVIQNGVNLAQFSYLERTPGFNLAVVGDINNKKNPAMWIEIMSRLVSINTQYTLNVAGNIQELRYKYYLENIINRLGLERNIKFHSRVEDIPEWFERERINYLLTTSVFESFGYSIAEAMAMGYKPLIHNFPGGYDNWPSNCIFSTTDELINLIQNGNNYDSKGYHDFVKDRYSLNVQFDKIDMVLNNLTNKDSRQATRVFSEKQNISTGKDVASPGITSHTSNLHKPDRNLIVTGIPRSGSSLFSVLINSIENAVCLNEIVYDVHKLPYAFEEIRKRLVFKTPIPNKYDSRGVLTSNTQDGIVKIEERVVEIVDDNVVVGSKVNIPYLNDIRKILDYGYKIIAVVRDPVFTIGSWNSKKTSHLDEARVTGSIMSPRWAHIPFTTGEKIGRQAQIWEFYAEIIWSLRNRIKIYTYEQVISNTEWILKDVCEYLGLNVPVKIEPLESLNKVSRYPDIAEIREAVKQYCPISREFGYHLYRSNNGPYKPQEYWENRGTDYEVDTKSYNSDIEIPTLGRLLEEYNLHDSAILEVGSGYGRIYQEVGMKCSNYTMCDFSNSMRSECKKRTGILPDYWNGHKLPYPDNSFDLVILFSVLLHVPEKQIESFFSEICRVTKEYIFIATYTGNLENLDTHVFKYNYNTLFINYELEITFEKKINNGLRTNWLLEKQIQRPGYCK